MKVRFCSLQDSSIEEIVIFVEMLPFVFFQNQVPFKLSYAHVMFTDQVTVDYLSLYNLEFTSIPSFLSSKIQPLKSGLSTFMVLLHKKR